jgi:hypothetical protein
MPWEVKKTTLAKVDKEGQRDIIPKMAKRQVLSKQSSKNKKNILIGLLLIIIFLLLLGVVGTVAFRLGQSQPSPSPSPSPTSSPSSPESSQPASTPTLAPESTAVPTSEPTPTPTPEPTAEPQADLYISEYSFDHSPVTDEPFIVRIGIYNRGDAAAGPFWWEWWSSHARQICRERIDSLAAHGGRVVYCSHTYTSWSTYATKAVADADNEVTESNEENNTHTENVVPIH